MKSGSKSKDYVMIIAEERGQLRTLFNDRDYINTFDETKLSVRARYNPGLYYYKVHCGAFLRYGLDADEVFDLINERYQTEGCSTRLDELFDSIERI